MNKRIGTFDTRTGEILDGTCVWFGTKIRSPYGRSWHMWNEEAHEELAADKEMTLESHRVFMYLNARLDFENFINVPQVEIAKKLGMNKPNVSRTIKFLEQKGLVIRGPKEVKTSTFRLNPYYGWKGKVKNLKRHLELAVDNENQNVPRGT